MVEKEFQISQLSEENEALKETVEKISRTSSVKSEPGKEKIPKEFLFENNFKD